MSFFNRILNHAMKKYTEKYEDQIIVAMDKINNGGTFEDLDTIVNDYYCLIKMIYKKCKPKSVVLYKDDYYLVSIDDVQYDFDELIHHNDQRGTEMKSQIEVLINLDTPIALIQDKLNKKIEADW